MRSLRLIGLVAAGLLLLAAGPLPAHPTEGVPARPAAAAWTPHCAEAPEGRFCTLRAEAGFVDNRGIRRGAALVFHVSQGCTSLHVELAQPLDEARPAWLRIGDGPALPFYRPSELKEVADALDERRPPRAAAPELAVFWREARAGVVGGPDDAAAELIARFARLKQGDRLGVGCEATARLLPDLARADCLSVSFFAPTRPTGEPWHLPARDRREIIVQLGNLPAALEGLPAVR